MPINYAETMKIPDTKKHYVPLCIPKKDSSLSAKGESFVLEPLFPCSSFNTVKPMKSSTTSAVNVPTRISTCSSCIVK